jgi:hypothetical protein
LGKGAAAGSSVASRLRLGFLMDFVPLADHKGKINQAFERPEGVLQHFSYARVKVASSLVGR